MFARVAYTAVYAAILWLTVQSIIASIRDSRPLPRSSTAVAVLALAFGPFLLKLFALRSTYLDSRNLQVRGLLRSWTIPIETVESVSTLRYYDFSFVTWSFVRVTFSPPAKGLGAHLRFIESIGAPPSQAEELIYLVREAVRAGA